MIVKCRKKIRIFGWITKNGKRRQIRLCGVWNGMKQRCSNKNNRSYRYYGGRGVTVCDEWLTFKAFRSWAISSGYRLGLTIDRINGNGNYEPGNCRWATWKQQFDNKKNGMAKLTECQVLSIRDDKRPQKEVAKHYGIAVITVSKIRARTRWGHLR